ncbi:MAG: hypothetical protein K2X27_21960 [Candidatus Obscuribacterales bacterium]|nr:hypothetical protein [Candidatus Obscuribacterales bacterium]
MADSNSSNSQLDDDTLFLLHASDPGKAANSPRKKSVGSWILAFTRFHKIPVFKRVWFYLFLMAAYTLTIDWVADTHLPNKIIKEAGAAAYSSVVLGILLVFRTNTAYERWAEGRRLWGQLVNDSRNLAFKTRAFLAVPEIEKMQLGQLIISFAYALKHHLRNTTPSEPLPGLGKINPDVKNLPVHVAGKIFDIFQKWKDAGYVDTLILLQLDYHLRAFMDICGACERIKNSPIAVSYRAFMRQGIILNLLLIPWILNSEFPIIWALPIILIGTYFLIGLELIAEDIEDPFGSDGDDLPLDTICGGIRSTITDILSLNKLLKYTRSGEMPVFDPLKQTMS